MQSIKAIHPKNQRQVNRTLKALIRYNEVNELRQQAEDNDEQKKLSSLNRKCENYFDKYLTELAELPKREIKQIETSKYY